MNNILKTFENKRIVKQEFGNGGSVENFKSECIEEVNNDWSEIKQEPVDSSRHSGTDCDIYEDPEQVVNVWIKDEVATVKQEFENIRSVDSFKSECIEELNNDCSEIKQNPVDSRTYEDSEQDASIKYEVEIVDNDFDYSEERSCNASDAESPKEIATGSDTRQLCSKEFIQSDHLKTHLLTIHCDKKTYKCELCGKEFNRPNNLKTHLLTIHSDKKTYKCELCGKEFNRPNNLKTHLLTIHSDKKTYKCELCGKEFKRPDHLKIHLLIHSDKKPHKCQLCSKEFNRSDHLKIHLLIHSDKKPHKCDLCSKEFTRLDHLKTHLLIHSDKKPHKCELCGKEFNWRGNLKKHMLVHTRLKPQV